MSDYSVIIPTLNEGAQIGDCIQSVRANNTPSQIIVADGGSTDQTCGVAEKAGARVVHSAKGRGIQCNRGARQASGHVLVFLHADTRLPPNALSLLDGLFADPTINIGTFRMRFDRGGWFLNSCAFFTRFDSIFTSFGDQCIAIRKLFFDDLGGFPDWPLFEDVDLLRRARRKTRVHSFPAEVTTSSRKFRRHGPIRRQAKNGLLILKYLMGVPPKTLAKEYNY